MKRIACVIIIVLLSTCIFSSVEPMSSVFGLTWQTSDTQYLRFGFASRLPETFGGNVLSVDSLAMGNPVRQGTDVIVTNTGALYAFCEAYGNSRFDVKVSAQDFALEGQEAIPFTVTWSDGDVESSTSASSASTSTMFSYQPNLGVYSQNRELRISASLPEQASSEEYTGYITLDLEVIE